MLRISGHDLDKGVFSEIMKLLIFQKFPMVAMGLFCDTETVKFGDVSKFYLIWKPLNLQGLLFLNQQFSVDGGFAPTPGHIWKYPETFLIVTMGGTGKSHLLLASGG